MRSGSLLPAVSAIGAVWPNAVLVLGCGEPFDAASVPERAVRMHAAHLARERALGPRVRGAGAGDADEAEGAAASAASACDEPAPSLRPPWYFSPSGKWATPLAHSEHDLAVAALAASVPAPGALPGETLAQPGELRAPPAGSG